MVKSGINRQDWTAFSTKVLELDAEGRKIGCQTNPEPLAKVEAKQDRERDQAQGSNSRKTQARPKRYSRDPVVKVTARKALRRGHEMDAQYQADKGKELTFQD